MDEGEAVSKGQESDADSEAKAQKGGKGAHSKEAVNPSARPLPRAFPLPALCDDECCCFGVLITRMSTSSF